MNQQYTVVYKNRLMYKGMDYYVKDGDGNLTVHANDALQLSLDEAIELTYKYPVWDTGHLVAQVAPVNEVQVQSKFVVGPAL